MKIKHKFNHSFWKQFEDMFICNNCGQQSNVELELCPYCKSKMVGTQLKINLEQ